MNKSKRNEGPVKTPGLTKRDAITVLVGELLKKHKVVAPPVAVQQIAEAEDISVHFQPFHGESDISAVLKRTEETAVIGINSAHSPTRQRFSIAHELGHFFLHKDETLFVDFAERLRRRPTVHFRDETSSKATNKEEVEANRFAATLLMPSDMVRHHLNKMLSETDDISAKDAIASLAATFHVSTAAMEFRLLNLGHLVKLD